MRVKIAENGWLGIFIPGDEALGWALSMRLVADAIDRPEPTIRLSDVAAGLRSKAAMLETCKVES